MPMIHLIIFLSKKLPKLSHNSMQNDFGCLVELDSLVGYPQQLSTNWFLIQVSKQGMKRLITGNQGMKRLITGNNTYKTN